MDMIERRMNMYMRESEESEEMKWETLIDYTTTEELDVGTHDVVRFDSSVIQKFNDAKKIACMFYFASPDAEQSAVGNISVSLYFPNKYYNALTFSGAINALPSKTSGASSNSYAYRMIDLEAISNIDDKNYTVYSPITYYFNGTYQTSLLNAYWTPNNAFVDVTTLRLINKNAVIGKGSRIRVLIMN